MPVVSWGFWRLGFSRPQLGLLLELSKRKCTQYLEVARLGALRVIANMLYGDGASEKRLALFRWSIKVALEALSYSAAQINLVWCSWVEPKVNDYCI